VWSAINSRRVKALQALGLMMPAGIAALERRDPARSGIYSFENPVASLPPLLERQFKASPKAWAFFHAQPPGYRRVAVFWVMSAKRDETRTRRLAQLVDASERQVRVGAISGQPRQQSL